LQSSPQNITFDTIKAEEYEK